MSGARASNVPQVEVDPPATQLCELESVFLPRLRNEILINQALEIMYFQPLFRGLSVTRFILSVLLSSFVAAPLSGAAQSTGDSAQSVANPQVKNTPALAVNGQEYVIAPDDLLDVYILDVPELSRTYRVSQSGAFVFPLLPKPLMAAGLTLDAFSALLTNELKTTGTISDPHLTVSVKESRLHSVSITGAVKSPQVYPLLGPSKLLAVLTQAGGISDDAGSILRVKRGGALKNFTPSTNSAPTPVDDAGGIVINLNDLLNGVNAGLNIDVYPGDWINVPRAGIIYVVGAVNRPGGYVLNTAREHLSVLQLVAIAEDLKPTAKRDHSMIIRRPAGGERQEIAIDLKKILAGKSPDVTLEANDILFVPESAGKKALRRGAEAVIQVATGLALYRL